MTKRRTAVVGQQQSNPGRIRKSQKALIKHLAIRIASWAEITLPTRVDFRNPRARVMQLD
jgi:hypothetical protein